MPPAGFEPATEGGDRPQTFALDRSATGNGRDSKLGLSSQYQVAILTMPSGFFVKTL